MIDELMPYPAYKDSGMPWLGKMPEHWSLSPNRVLMRRRKVLVGQRHNEYRLLSLTKEGIIVRDVESGKGKFSVDMGTSQEVRNGDLVFCLFDVPETPRTVGLSHHDGMITGAYTVFECFDPMLSAFLDLYYRAMDDRKLLGPLYSGLRNTIPPTRFLGTKTPVPPPTEQAAIVRFLDHADRHIRRYIRVKQKLIKLLDEQKQSIIHRAITCGLDPNGPTQPLRSAPECRISSGWKISRLWEVSCLRSEKGRPELELLSVFLGRGVIRYGEGGGQVHKPSLDLSGYQVVHPGDLVLNNQQAWRGSVGVSAHHGIISPAYVVLPLHSSLYSRFADYLFKSRMMVSQFVTASKGVGDIQRDIHMPWLKNVRVPIPPLTEQHRITENLDRELVEIEKQLKLFDHEISLLREYRTRLIADVVTGKLDVRGVTANLPKEADELETHDDADADEEGDIDSAEGNLDVSPEEAEA
jgi:type I restriction enzyme S subunit